MRRTFLRTNRQKKQLTLRETAEKIGIDHRYLSKIELGKKDPSLKVACRLEKFFGIPVCTLLKRDGDDE